MLARRRRSDRRHRLQELRLHSDRAAPPQVTRMIASLRRRPQPLMPATGFHRCLSSCLPQGSGRGQRSELCLHCSANANCNLIQRPLRGRAQYPSRHPLLADSEFSVCPVSSATCDCCGSRSDLSGPVARGMTSGSLQQSSSPTNVRRDFRHPSVGE